MIRLQPCFPWPVARHRGIIDREHDLRAGKAGGAVVGAFFGGFFDGVAVRVGLLDIGYRRLLRRSVSFP